MTNLYSESLADRVAIVTGGSRGIGLATAMALREAVADVLVCGRSRAALERAGANLVHAPGAGRVARRWSPMSVAMTKRSAWWTAAVDELGTVDVLVNNAGIGRFGPASELAVDAWIETIETNLSGVFYCCRAAIPVMRRGRGWIVNVSSLAGKHPFAGGGAYCASKAGLNALTESLMQELRGDGIRVSCVLPGSVNTEFGGDQPAAHAHWKLDASDVARTVVDLLRHSARSLPSRVELRPSVPKK